MASRELRSRACWRAAPQQPRQQVRERARRHDQVQRDQQVHGPPVGGDRQPEGQREDRQQRERVRRGGASAATSSGDHDAARRAARRRARPRRAASRRASPADRAHRPTSVKLRGESTVRPLFAQAHPHAVFARRARARRRFTGTRIGAPAVGRQRAGSGAPCRGARSSAARTVCSAATGRSRTSVATTLPPASMIVTVTASACGELEGDLLLFDVPGRRTARRSASARTSAPPSACA